MGDRTPESLCPGPGGDRLVAFTVLELRELGLTVREDPTDDEPAHVLVEGDKSKRVKGPCWPGRLATSFEPGIGPSEGSLPPLEVKGLV